ncbi:MAG TPA: alpha/beta hydrolase [Chryseolinea sp.]|nr:alpha/beta hydrolase [Chryseolinea sp.]
MSYLKIEHANAKAPVQLYYEDRGQGTPVVLIHGWPLSSVMWEYQVEGLVSSGFRVIAYDRRGFGMSSRPNDGYDYDTLAEDLKALLDELDLQNVTLVGFSMGGGEVARYFGKYGGERVSKVVLIGAVTPFMLKTTDNPDGIDASFFDEMMAEMKKDRIAFLDNFGKQFFGVSLINKPVSTPFLEFYRTIAAMASPRATQECAKSFSRTDFRKDLKAIQVPTLIIHGDADKTVPIEVSGDKTAKAIKQATYIRYGGAPHGLFYTERERLNQDLIQFIGVQVETPEILGKR